MAVLLSMATMPSLVPRLSTHILESLGTRLHNAYKTAVVHTYAKILHLIVATEWLYAFSIHELSTVREHLTCYSSVLHAHYMYFSLHIVELAKSVS